MNPYSFFFLWTSLSLHLFFFFLCWIAFLWMINLHMLRCQYLINLVERIKISGLTTWDTMSKSRQTYQLSCLDLLKVWNSGQNSGPALATQSVWIQLCKPFHNCLPETWDGAPCFEGDLALSYKQHWLFRLWSQIWQFVPSIWNEFKHSVMRYLGNGFHNITRGSQCIFLHINYPECWRLFYLASIFS